MSELIPIEKDGQRVLTTQQLALAYGVDDKKIRDNFTNNKDRYIQGKHYFKLEGDELRQFKNDTENFGAVGERASSVYLWTERGALLHAKSLNTDKAWQVYDMLVETYFRVKENKPSCIEDILIVQLQEMKKLKEQTTKALTTATQAQKEVQAIKDIIVINPKAEWRDETNKILCTIGYQNKEYQKVKDEVYKALEQRARCNLKLRLENLQARALSQGMAPSKVKALNNLDVIENDARLKEIYIAIVKEMAIKCGVKIKEEAMS